ncbi:fucosyltransferase 1 [Perilla frutescens var. frutescens]|nr:fucosyltransferase 1 [Perilla frutescens var. frutescens]
MKFMALFLISLMAFFVFFMPSDHDARNLYFKLQKVLPENDDDVGEEELFPARGLFDEKSCLSRYESLSYRRQRRGLKQRAPSPDLISKLRSYEARHKRCAPYTDSYNKTVDYLVQNSSTFSCKYVVWISMNGLGNQMLSMASAFLYALLTDRVLLVDRGVDIPDLFCEPFPEASWFLPSAFPFTSDHFNSRSPQSYGNLLRNKRNTNTNITNESYIYLNLAHGYDKYDKRVFCDADQTYLQTIPWLVIKSDFYFVPALFLMPSFQQQLHQLFPEKDTVFHLLSRYLFHPTNSVWGLVTRYYQAYLSKAHVITGIQLRIFRIKPLLEQILSCTMRENDILPKIKDNNKSTSNLKNNTTVAVLITSLTSGYYDKIREMYLENPTAAGEVVGVFQPSHEEFQQTGKHSHNRKALAEIYLLSLTDRLVTSGWSTFGYVAQGIGGLQPWILYRPENPAAPDPPCRRAMSMEPCFQGPRSYDCNSRRGGMDKDVRHCEDMSRGLKLVQHHTHQF